MSACLPDCPKHWTVHDVGRGARGSGQYAVVRGVLPCLAESGGGHTWLAMAVAKGKGVRGCSFSPGESILGGNQRRTRYQLYQTLLGAPAKSCVQEKGEGCCLVCYDLPR